VTATVAETSEAGVTRPQATLSQRLGVAALVGLTRLLQRLPDGPVYRAAYGLGWTLSFLMPRRRALVRSNLARVCRWIDAQGAAAPAVHAAATSNRALAAFTRAVFGHWVVSYTEAAMAPRYSAPDLRDRIVLETPRGVEEALTLSTERRGRMFVSLHLGSLELAGLYASRVGGIPVVGPMETVANPALASYFERSRAALGVRLLPLAGAAAELRAALARGEGVGMVADRVIGGQGARVELFGAPARLPIGPAVLAVESTVPMHVLALRRGRPGHWIGRMEVIEPPMAGTRKQRVRGTLAAQARVFERLITDAPEQWWTLLFPIWDPVPDG
jgi:lauroyl/myristoyl acyltransferase